MGKNFRALILDDNVFGVAEKQIERTNDLKSDLNFWNQQGCGFVAEVFSEPSDYPVEVFVAANVRLDELLDVEAMEVRNLSDFGDSINDFLGTLDVLVLDMRGIERPDVDSDMLKRNIIANFTQIEKQLPSDLDTAIDSATDGVLFFHHHLQSIDKNCAVVILTAFDGQNDRDVERFIHPFTLAGESLPFVSKFGKGHTTNASLADLVISQFEFVQSGLTDATNRRQIAFAACHDLPVLIVGESGTGKERIAQAIHRLWSRKKQRKLGRRGGKLGQLQVLNCAGLDSQLARGELFGFVKGSFTGAEQHHLGLALVANGILRIKGRTKETHPGKKWQEALSDLKSIVNIGNQLPERQTEDAWDVFSTLLIPTLTRLLGSDDADQAIPLFEALKDAERMIETRTAGGGSASEYRDLLVASSKGLLKQASDDNGPEFDLIYTEEEPLASLFLDEFGDLPLETQTLLLRFLQSGEVSPIGYAGSIRGLKTRVIVATSDSRVADFAGQPISNDFRSKAEYERPLRYDLLHRVKGQVIRVEPVNEENVRGTIEAMVRGKTSPSIRWQPCALDFLEREVVEILKSQSAVATMAFGNRRELGIFVDLVWEYARNASEIGIRDHSISSKDGELVVGKAVVESLWNPGVISLNPGVADTEHDKHQPDANEDIIQEVRKKFVVGMLDVGLDLVELGNWKWDDVEAFVVRESRGGKDATRDAVRKLLSEIDKENKGSRKTVASVACRGPGLENQTAIAFNSLCSAMTKKRIEKKVACTLV